MRLLREYIRMLLNEQSEYFGKTFDQFKERTAPKPLDDEGMPDEGAPGGEHPLKVAKELKLKKIGQGSTRLAYELPDDLESVIKIINVELDPWSDDPNKELDAPDYVNPITGFNRKQKLDSNAWEADLQIQQRYPGVFPKSFEVAKDFSWILVERIKLIDGAKMVEFLNLPASYSIHQMQIAVKDTIDYMYDKFVSRKHNYMSNYLNEDDSAATYRDPEDKQILGYEPRQVRDVKSILSSPHNRRLFLAAAELGIPYREFKPSNFGLSTIDGKEHLIILDASLWAERSKLKENIRRYLIEGDLVSDPRIIARLVINGSVDDAHKLMMQTDIDPNLVIGILITKLMRDRESALEYAELVRNVTTLEPGQPTLEDFYKINDRWMTLYEDIYYFAKGEDPESSPPVNWPYISGKEWFVDLYRELSASAN